MSLNSAIDAHSQILNLSDITADFWYNYSIKKSPGDGHCFLHSVIQSCNSQFPDKPSMNKDILIDLFRVEIHKNCSRYLPYVEDMSRDNLFLGFYDYVYNKNYNTAFGDLVPVIASRALGMGIMIVYKQEDKTMTVFIEHRENHSCENLFIFKDRDHYDALVTTLSPEHRSSAFDKNVIYGDCILSKCATDNKETDKACG